LTGLGWPNHPPATSWQKKKKKLSRVLALGVAGLGVVKPPTKKIKKKKKILGFWPLENGENASFFFCKFFLFPVMEVAKPPFSFLFSFFF
jgi:hypothetical protein